MESAKDPPPRNNELANALQSASIRIMACLAQSLDQEGVTAELQREIERILASELAPLESHIRITQGSAQVAHELRNPLAVISTSAEIIASKTEDPGILKHTARIVRQAQTASALANELLSAATAMLSIKLKDVTLWDVVTESVEQLRQRLPLSVCMDPHAWGDVVLIDERRTLQILANLLTNAVHAKPSGARVSLSVTRTRTHCELHVVDQSGGIREERWATIFDDQPSEKQGSGHGIGLPLSRRLARLQGGDLSLFASTLEGSHFVLSLPLAKAES